MQRGDAHDSICFAVLGITPVLMLTSDEARQLTPMDLALLRELGADDALLARVAVLAATPDVRLQVDIAAGTVTIMGDDPP